MALPGIATLDTYGGIKQDAYPLTDPTTDMSAAEGNAAFSDVAMMTACCMRAWVQFSVASSTPTLVAHNAMWGTGAGVAPVIARSTTGVYTITWPATVQDQLSNSFTLALRACSFAFVSGTYLVTISVLNNVATVSFFTTASTPSATDPTCTINVFAI